MVRTTFKVLTYGNFDPFRCLIGVDGDESVPEPGSLAASTDSKGVATMLRRKIYSLACWAGVLLVAVSAQATSHVRIVRLSYVDGKVEMDRANGQGLERAVLNSPVVEGSRILTGSNGLAEVEFEDNSVVRLGEATDIKFSQLLINDAGDKVNEVSLLRGSLYFDTRNNKSEIDRVIAAGQTFLMRRDSQVRFQMIGDQVQAAVFTGEVTMDNGGQLVRLKKNDTLTVDSANPSGYLLAKGVDSLPLDRWSTERHSYQDAYAYNNVGSGNKALSGYGYSDLAYYGAFMNVPGYGMAWQPFGASNWIGWNPYLSGTWNYLGGMGYVWSSAYAWGWMPYHYGSWANVPAYGWVWVPGNTLKNGGVVTNWQATAPVVKSPAGYSAPVPPTSSPSGSHPAIMVGRIGNAPAYLPDGQVPPNFRSVIQDHSGLAGLNSNSSFRGSSGSSFASPASRAISPARASAMQNGHVFATPPGPRMMPGMMDNGFGSPGWGGHGSGSSGHSWAASTRSAGGGAHIGGTTAGRGTASTHPK